ncbi:transporter [Actinoplanes regularis]|nr:transporter [Actinoplanes regularis]
MDDAARRQTTKDCGMPMRTWMPGVETAAGYRRAWLGRDVTAGLVLTTLLVPQGMAYAELAGLPPITGLYTTMLCLLAYAVFGPSRTLVLGPDSSLGPMIAAVLVGVLGSGGDPVKAIALGSMLALLVGVLMTVAGVTGLGFVADLLSKPTRIGYMCGLALTILVSQLPKLCGFSVDADGLIPEATAFVRGVVAGEIVPAALLVGVFGIALIKVLQWWLPKVPGVLATVVVSIIAVSVFGLEGHGVELVGALPQGLPRLTVPHVSWSDLGVLVGGAVGIALVSLTDTISNASAYAARSGQEVRGNQEMIGIGTANIAASLFQGFPVSTSASRTAVAEQSGAKSQLTGVVGAVTIGLILLFVPGLLRNLPLPILAAVVIAASMSMVDLPALRRLRQQRRMEFSLAVVAFLAVALLGVLAGIAVAVALSVLNIFRRAWWPYQAVLGRAAGVSGYHDVQVYPDAEHLPGLVLFRFDAPLFFANSRVFREHIRRLARTDPRPTWIVIAAEPITDIDTTAADMLEELDEELTAAGITLVFAELKSMVRAKVDRYKLTRTIDPTRFFPTLDDAVASYAARTGADWSR